MTLPENVAEYWFANYYRVLVINLENGSKVLSVDVYRKAWLFGESEAQCIENNKYCLLYKVLEPKPETYELKRAVIEKIIVTGVKVGDIYETVNVRWFIRGELEAPEIEKIFYWSWEIIGCKGPRESPWYHGCQEE